MYFLFSASLKLIQLVVIGLTVVYHHTTHQIYFSLRDMKNMLKRAQKKIGKKFLMPKNFFLFIKKYFIFSQLLKMLQMMKQF